jgi:transposase
VNKSLREHYRKLLGLEKPWEVVAIELAMEHKRVEIRLTHRKGARVSCPECGGECAIHDEAPERQWRHLDIMQFETLLCARIPRSNFHLAPQLPANQLA